MLEHTNTELFPLCTFLYYRNFWDVFYSLFCSADPMCVLQELDLESETIETLSVVY